jgi:hypothetical protein
MFRLAVQDLVPCQRGQAADDGQNTVSCPRTALFVDDPQTPHRPMEVPPYLIPFPYISAQYGSLPFLSR